MKKKYVTILIAQTILIFIMLLFAFIQKSQADKAKDTAIAAQKLALENEKIAHELAARYDSLLQAQNRK